MERSPREPNSAAVGRRPGRGRRWRGESGLETIEYALIAAVILTALLASIPLIAAEVFPAYSTIIDAIINALPG